MYRLTVDCAVWQIFNGVVFLLCLLGILVIYALVLGDVETKTYECVQCRGSR